MEKIQKLSESYKKPDIEVISLEFDDIIKTSLSCPQDTCPTNLFCPDNG